jgi:hypothetical protein
MVIELAPSGGGGKAVYELTFGNASGEAKKPPPLEVSFEGLSEEAVQVGFSVEPKKLSRSLDQHRVVKWLADLGRCCAGGHHQNGDPFLRAGRERAAGHTARPHCVPRHDAVGRGEAEGAVQRRGAGDAPTRVAAAPQGARPWASSNGRGSGRHGPQMSRRIQRSRVCLLRRVV